MLSVLDWLKDFANNYGSLTTLIFGAIGALATYLFGGMLFRALAQHRIQHLEKELDEKKDELSERNKQLEACCGELVEVRLRADALDGRLRVVTSAFEGGNDNLWVRRSIPSRPKDYDEKIPKGIPILLLANLKGGVGKTTLAANLAAYFETVHKERVLAIDLDYQGSLSSMLLSDPQNRESRTALGLRRLIGGSADVSSVFSESKPIRGSKRDSRIIDCDDPFANFETQLHLRWLIGEEKKDIRFNLARVLCDDEIQRKFHRIIIDAPPRLTTGFVNALCASTHLVVPFVLDLLSAERVGLFLGAVKQMKPKLFPHLELAAVVGTMKGDGTQKLREIETKALAEAKRRVELAWGHGDYVLEKLLVPRKQSIADVAGLSIAYYESDEVKTIINPIGDVIFNRTRREHPRYEGQHIEGSLAELRRGTADFGVERVQ